MKGRSVSADGDGDGSSRRRSGGRRRDEAKKHHNTANSEDNCNSTDRNGRGRSSSSLDTVAVTGGAFHGDANADAAGSGRGIIISVGTDSGNGAVGLTSGAGDGGGIQYELDTIPEVDTVGSDDEGASTGSGSRQIALGSSRTPQGRRYRGNGMRYKRHHNHAPLPVPVPESASASRARKKDGPPTPRGAWPSSVSADPSAILPLTTSAFFSPRSDDGASDTRAHVGGGAIGYATSSVVGGVGGGGATPSETRFSDESPRDPPDHSQSWRRHRHRHGRNHKHQHHKRQPDATASLRLWLTRFRWPISIVVTTVLLAVIITGAVIVSQNHGQNDKGDVSNDQGGFGNDDGFAIGNDEPRPPSPAAPGSPQATAPSPLAPPTQPTVSSPPIDESIFHQSLLPSFAPELDDVARANIDDVLYEISNATLLDAEPFDDSDDVVLGEGPQGASARYDASGNGMLYFPNPQASCRHWLKFDDPLRLRVDKVGDIRIAQRFALCVLVLAATGDAHSDASSGSGGGGGGGGNRRLFRGGEDDKDRGMTDRRATDSRALLSSASGTARAHRFAREGSGTRVLAGSDATAPSIEHRSNECVWEGVSCADDIVTGIAWSSCDLSGYLPEELLLLQDLKVVVLQNNSITGTLPNSLFLNLPKLYLVDLGLNQLSGRIPAPNNDAGELELLYLDDNLLTGHLPLFSTVKSIYVHGNLLDTMDHQYATLPDLTKFVANGNTFDGTLPAQWVVAESKLEYLDLGHNSFTGTIPSEIWELPLLAKLFLQVNYLNGTLPTSSSSAAGGGIGNNNNADGNDVVDNRDLSRVWLYSNLISGFIPENFALNWPNLTQLMLQNSPNLQGTISASHCAAWSLLEHLEADCGGDSPRVSCECCTQCFVPGS